MGCIIMNPQNGEIYAMSSYPEYNLNNPRDLSAFYSPEKIDKMSDKKKTEILIIVMTANVFEEDRKRAIDIEKMEEVILSVLKKQENL